MAEFESVVGALNVPSLAFHLISTRVAVAAVFWITATCLPSPERMGEVTIAPVTTTFREIPTEVVLTSADGMPRDCAINLDHVQTVSRKKIGALITALAPERMGELRAALLFALGF